MRKWSDLSNILKAEPTGLANGLVWMGEGKRDGSKLTKALKACLGRNVLYSLIYRRQEK